MLVYSTASDKNHMSRIPGNFKYNTFVCRSWYTAPRQKSHAQDIQATLKYNTSSMDQFGNQWVSLQIRYERHAMWFSQQNRVRNYSMFMVNTFEG
jgi:hypothetical protein